MGPEERNAAETDGDEDVDEGSEHQRLREESHQNRAEEMEDNIVSKENVETAEARKTTGTLLKVLDDGSELGSEWLRLDNKELMFDWSLFVAGHQRCIRFVRFFWSRSNDSGRSWDLDHRKRGNDFAIRVTNL